MRTDFASWVLCISIESLVGKVVELSRGEVLSRGEEVVGKVLENATKLLELLEGEMTKTVEGEPVESARAKLPVEPLIWD